MGAQMQTIHITAAEVLEKSCLYHYYIFSDILGYLLFRFPHYVKHLIAWHPLIKSRFLPGFSGTLGVWIYFVYSIFCFVMLNEVLYLEHKIRVSLL
ncbi:hypothetical protein CICLE_v10033179mg [Citrus x clementina]|uniref:Uncharacterized protein n=1 Tax=Citrus clementina TaxID=85681 RepID=V4TE69_CITCL|nr:hypothetical protein CICLE_v10033179mg [Citrus x clementina]